MPKNMIPKKLDDITRRPKSFVTDFQISVKKRPVFFVTPLLVLLVVIGAVLWYQHSTKAQVVEFYPSSCLGSWLYPGNASGQPDVPVGALFGDFNNNNSAVYDGENKEIYCGGFTGDIPKVVSIEKVTLKLHWVNSKKREVISTTPEGSIVEQIIEMPTTQSMGDDFEQSSESATDGTPEDQEIQNEESVNDPEPALETQDSAVDILVEDEELVPVEEVPVEEVPATEPQLLPQARLPKLFHVAMAAEIDTPPSTTGPSLLLDESGNVVIPEPVLVDDPNNIPIGNELEEEINSDPVVVDPAVIQKFSGNANRPPVDDTALFVIDYSLDGNTWEFLTYVYADAWPTELELPVYSYADLAKLQISIKSLPLATDNLIVWLDNMSLAISYQSDEEIAIKKSVTPAERRQLKTFDERSQHTCTVEPFNINAPIGATTTATVTLNPFSNQDRRLLVGNLPVGVAIDFAESNTLLVPMTVTAHSEASAGSYNIIVVYQEEQYNDEWLPNFCQFNLIIE